MNFGKTHKSFKLKSILKNFGYKNCKLFTNSLLQTLIEINKPS